MRTAKGERSKRRSGTFSVLGCFLLVCLPAVPVRAETFTYHGVVTFPHGIFEGLVPKGAPVELSYTLDPSATDTVSDLQMGSYPNAVLELSVSFPSVGVFVGGGSGGRVTVFNDIPDKPSGRVSDQVSVMGAAVSSESGFNEDLSSIEVVFLSDFVVPPEEPMMIDSDALPLFRLRPADSFVSVESASGPSSVQFQVQQSHGGDGCSVGPGEPGTSALAWLLLFPTLMSWAARNRRLVCFPNAPPNGPATR